MPDDWFEDPGNDRTKIANAISGARTAIAEAMKPNASKDSLEKAVLAVDRASVLWIRFLSAAQQLKQGNDALVSAMNEVKAEMQGLQEEINRLVSPPLVYATFISANDDGTANITHNGRKLRVQLDSSIKLETLIPGQEVIVNDVFAIVAAGNYENRGDYATVKEVLDGGRVVITVRHDEECVALVGGPLRGERLKVGDPLMFDGRSGYVVERLPKFEMEDLALEEVPDISYEDIGGLESQIEAIRDAVELPYLHPDFFRDFRLTPPKGVLLYGPPGCGKTMIAKAVANSLAKQVSARKGQSIKGFFLNIKGPELLTKWVGDTEKKIREAFLKAREKASEEVPVVVFFDEMDALFRTRGSGISSDVESTIVPQFLVELDGIEGLRNIVVIGASNRQDLIDPAILRPGRLDVKIRIDRPDATAAFRILSKYSKPGIPLHSKFYPFPKHYETPNRLKTLAPKEWAVLDVELLKIREAFGLVRSDLGEREIKTDESALQRAADSVAASDYEREDRARIERDLGCIKWSFEAWEIADENAAFNYLNYKTVEGMFIATSRPLVWVSSEGETVTLDTRFLEVTYANADKEILHHKDFVSGAMLESIVRRAKTRALKRAVASGVKGVMMIDFWNATRDEFSENEDLPNTTNPDDWARIQGKKGARVVDVRPLSTRKMMPLPHGANGRNRGTETINTGQYL